MALVFRLTKLKLMMMSASKFYRSSVCTTLQQPRSHVESVSFPKSIVILLPEFTNLGQVTI